MGKRELYLIERDAIDYAGNRDNGAGHGYPSFTANLLQRGYVTGATDVTRRKDKIIKRLKRELKLAQQQSTC